MKLLKRTNFKHLVFLLLSIPVFAFGQTPDGPGYYFNAEFTVNINAPESCKHLIPDLVITTDVSGTLDHSATINGNSHLATVVLPVQEGNRNGWPTSTLPGTDFSASVNGMPLVYTGSSGWITSMCGFCCDCTPACIRIEVHPASGQIIISMIPEYNPDHDCTMPGCDGDSD